MSPPARAWFRRAFDAPTNAQLGAWEAIRTGASTLVIAPTGSGKTLAAFFAALDRLTTRGMQPPMGTSVLYISPLKALAVDVERNLRAPLAGIRQEAQRLNLTPPEVSVGIRTGDTPADERRRQRRYPPDILITTPESLFLLLTSAARETLRSVSTVIVDEIHAVAGSKRGTHLAVSLERLDELLPAPAQRIGLSATVRPVSAVARFLGGAQPVTVVAEASQKVLDIEVEVPVADLADIGASTGSIEGSTAAEAGHSSIWPHVEQRLVELVRRHTSTLIFVNSRRLAERLTSRMNDTAAALGVTTDVTTPLVRAHHGSVSKEQRAVIEEELKAGRLPGVVATSSLELGIDMGAIDLVIQVEAPPSVAAGLQRIGRAGHHVGAVSKGTVFPKHRGDLVAAAVVADLMMNRQIESLRLPENPLDVLAQQVIAAVAMDDWQDEDLLALCRRAASYATLPHSAWLAVLDMVSGRYPADAFAELRPRIVWDRQTGTLSARPGAQRLAVTSGGTIPDRGLFAVTLVGSDGGKLGELDEEMVYESRVGDVFALGAGSWRIEEISHDRVWVSPAPGQPGKTPFWHGDALGRSFELGQQVGAFTRTLAAATPTAAHTRLREIGLDEFAAHNVMAYLADQRAATGRLPSDRTVLLERCRDEVGDWQVVLHSPFGARVHAPWSQLIAARLRQTTGIDVQVMPADDGIVLRIPDTDDDQLWAEVREAVLVDPADVRRAITEDIAGSALFAARFRECAARALLLPRRDPRRRAPLWQQRQRSAQLLAVVADYPEFPIAIEAARECMQDVYDLDALTEILTGLDTGSIGLYEQESVQPSPFATSLLFGYVAAFMYEGDTPLAERRAQALTLDPSLLAELLGSEELRDLLDPDALAAVAADVAWHTPERRLRHLEDLADALRVLGPLTLADIADRGGDPAWAHELVFSRRAIEVHLSGTRFAAVEDAGRLRDGLGVALPPGLPAAFTEPHPDPLAELVARYARTHGPFPSQALAADFGLGVSVVDDVLGRLATRGLLVSGYFRPEDSGVQWCDAQVLRRIRRRSIAALRRQAEPVSPATYATFLTQWHGITTSEDNRSPVSRAPNIRSLDTGLESVLRVIDQLAGYPIPASAWETLVLPTRVPGYRRGMLDMLCSRGEIIWCGAGALPGGDGWVTAAPADVPQLLPAPVPVDGEMAAAICQAVDAGGGWFYQQIMDRVSTEFGAGFDPAEFHLAIIDLVWAGWLTNDNFGLAGLPRQPKQRTLASSTPSPGRPLRARRTVAQRGRPSSHSRKAGAQATGRFSLLSRTEQDTTVRAADLAPWLLERHAVVSRGSMTGERYPGGFALAYKVFSAMEDAGSAVRAYAVEGLGGAQFTTIGIIDQLRDSDLQRRRATETGTSCATPVVLAATDPAQPYGAALSWPPRIAEDLGHRPGRKAGAVVVLNDGSPVLFLERGGKSMLSWPAPAEHLTAAATALATSVRRDQLPPPYLNRIDGVNALISPIAPALIATGFVETPRGLRLPRS